MAKTFDDQLDELVSAIVNIDDPTLYDRACSALTALIEGPPNLEDLRLL
jgi:hypothetical protein